MRSGRIHRNPNSKSTTVAASDRWTETYAGRVECCPPVSQFEYSGTDGYEHDEHNNTHIYFNMALVTFGYYERWWYLRVMCELNAYIYTILPVSHPSVHCVAFDFKLTSYNGGRKEIVDFLQQLGKNWT